MTVAFCLGTCSQAKGYRHSIRDAVLIRMKGFSLFLWIFFNYVEKTKNINNPQTTCKCFQPLYDTRHIFFLINKFIDKNLCLVSKLLQSLYMLSGQEQKKNFLSSCLDRKIVIGNICSLARRAMFLLSLISRHVMLRR